MVSLLRRLVALGAIVTFLFAAGIGPLIPGHLGPSDDAACGTDPLVGGNRQIREDAVERTSTPTHCPFCHLQRVVGGADLVVRISSGAPPLATDRILPPGPDALRADVLGPHFSRGPPFEA